MHRIGSLLRKELRTYFHSPIAYIVVTVLLIGIGYFFWRPFFLTGQADLRAFFRYASWSFLLFAPAITMKLIAEEKKTGTIEGLLTLPIREHEVVFGKFLAAWALLAAYLLVTLAYPVSIAFLGDLDWGPVIGGYLGLLLLGAVYLSIGLFASTLTRNQVVSLIVAFIICLALFLLDLVLPLVPDALVPLFSFAGVDTHFTSIGRGVLDTRDLFYYASLTSLFLFLAAQALESRLSDHSAVRRINKPLYVGAAVGTFVCLNLASVHAFARFDLTRDRMFTLTGATKSVLADLDDQLLVKCYFSKDLPAPFNNHARFLRDQLEEYRTYSGGKVRVEFVDPGKGGGDPKEVPPAAKEARQAGVPQVEVDTLQKDQRVAVKVFMGLAMYYHDRSEVLPVLQDVSNLEYELTGRVAKLVREKTPVVAFLAGHGEATPEAGLQMLGGVLKENYEIKTVDLSQEGATLDGVSVLVVAGANQEVPAWQRFRIDQFVMGGGRAAFLVDRNQIDMQQFMGRPVDDGLGDLLAAYGVTVGRDLVLDETNQLVTIARSEGGFRVQSRTPYPPFIRVRDLPKDNPLTKNLQDLGLPFMSSLSVAAQEGVTATVLARSSQRTWKFPAEDTFLVDPPSLPQPVDGKYDGPQVLVVALEGSLTGAFAGKPIPGKDEGGEPVAASALDRSPTTRVVVAGGSLFARDEVRNRLGVLLANNLVDWMAQDERLVAIRGRGVVNRPLKEISDGGKTAFEYGNMIGLPLAFVAFGVVTWRLRVARKRRGYVPPAEA